MAAVASKVTGVFGQNAIKTVTVIGGGLMGSGIAQASVTEKMKDRHAKRMTDLGCS